MNLYDEIKVFASFIGDGLEDFHTKKMILLYQSGGWNSMISYPPFAKWKKRHDEINDMIPKFEVTDNGIIMTTKIMI